MAVAAVIMVLVGAVVAAADEPPAGSRVWACPSASTSTAAPIPVVVAPGIVAWTAGRALHAVRLADGRPPWGSSGRPGSSEIVSLQLLLPEQAGAGLADAAISTPCSQGGRAYVTVMTAPHGPSAGTGLLAAIDCSNAAEGRVEWTANLPRGAAAFTGPPRVEGETIVAPVRTAGPRATIQDAAFDILDGRFLMLRPFHDVAAASATSIAIGDGRRIFSSGRSIECRQVVPEEHVP